MQVIEPPWILVLCHEFPPLGGGAGKNLYLLCRELTRRGVKVRVWTGDPGESKRWPMEFPIEYIDVGRKARFETSLRGMARFILTCRSRARALRASPPALIFSNLGIPAGVAGTLIKKSCGAPHAVWYQGSDVHAGRPAGAGAFQRLILRWIWKSAALSFFVSPGLRAMAESFGHPPRPGIMPTCPSPEILSAARGEDEISDRRYFLFLSRFDPVKNPVLLAEAALRLKPTTSPQGAATEEEIAAPPASAKSGAMVTRKLRMIGTGGLVEDVKRFVRIKALSANVSLEPAAPFEKVPELLRSAYALIVPSRVEGFNTTILEAAHFGVPSIGSDTIGIRDFIKHGETGLLFKENDVEGLAGAMRKLEADPALRDALGARAREAARRYRPELVADFFLTEIAACGVKTGAAAGLERRKTGAESIA